MTRNGVRFEIYDFPYRTASHVRIDDKEISHSLRDRKLVADVVDKFIDRVQWAWNCPKVRVCLQYLRARRGKALAMEAIAESVRIPRGISVIGWSDMFHRTRWNSLPHIS